MTKKELIVRAATVFFADRGFKDTSMSEISKATGAAEGTIFYHFKNKEELFISILQDAKDDILREFENYLLETEFELGLDMLEGAISFYVNLAESMENRFLLLHRHDAYEMSKANATCRDHLEALYDSLAGIFEHAILIGQADGSIRAMPARKTALLIFAMVDGLARLNTFGLYEAGTLYRELVEACRRMAQKEVLRSV